MLLWMVGCTLFCLIVVVCLFVFGLLVADLVLLLVAFIYYCYD